MEIQQLARLGAQVRYQEVQTEMSSLIKMFPELNGHEPKKRGRPAKHLASGTTVIEPPKKRTMSRKARAMISAAQKKRWAALHRETKPAKTNGAKHVAAKAAVEMTHSNGEERHKARQRSVELLALFGEKPQSVKEVIPTNMDARGIGALLRSGYLKRLKKGYVRTTKQFSV